MGKIISGASLRDGPPILTVEEKMQAKKSRRHQSHNNGVRRRRDTINETILSLEDLLPTSMIRKVQAEKLSQSNSLGLPAENNYETKLSKVDILQLTLQHLGEITKKENESERCQELERELRNSKAEVSQLRQTCDQVEARLATHMTTTTELHARLGALIMAHSQIDGPT